MEKPNDTLLRRTYEHGDNVLVFHTNNPGFWCDDGYGAVFAFLKMLNRWGYENPERMVTLKPTMYGDKLDLTEIKGKNVILLDFSFKADHMEEILSAAAHVTWVDHHDSLESVVAVCDAHGPNKCYYSYDKSHSAAVLAWSFFNPDLEVPKFYKYLEARDMWRLEALPRLAEVHTWIRSHVKSFCAWNRAVRFLEQKENWASILEEAVGISRSYSSMCERMTCTAKPAKFAGKYKIMYANIIYPFNSDVSHMLLTKNPDIRFCLTFDMPKVGVYNLSFRSRKLENGLPEFDVGALARKLGGGGHATAAGVQNVPAAVLYELLGGS